MKFRLRAVPILLVAALGVLTARARASVLQAAGAIPLAGIQGRIDHMAATADGRLLFVAALGANRLLSLDTQSARAIAAAKVSVPQGVCYLPKSGKVAVAAGGAGTLTFYTRDLKPLGAVRGLDDADNVRYDADANLVYAGYGEGALAVIDPERAVQTAKIPLDGHPESFQLEMRGTRIFVNVPSAGEIEVIDRASRKLLYRWKLKEAAANFPMALDEAGKRLFIGTRNPARMVVLEAQAGREVAMLSACGDTDDLFYDTVSRLIYLTGGQGCVSVFRQADSMTYDRLASVTTAPGARTALLVPGVHRLYVAVPQRGAQRAEIMIFNTP